uniref:Cytochrome-c oxidase n=1 Tax=Caenorhabditis tropicalis TaxID=1561998 RepID=A0A1I7U5G9_9PELO
MIFRNMMTYWQPLLDFEWVMSVFDGVFFFGWTPPLHILCEPLDSQSSRLANAYKHDNFPPASPSQRHHGF